MTANKDDSDDNDDDDEEEEDEERVYAGLCRYDHDDDYFAGCGSNVDDDGNDDGDGDDVMLPADPARNQKELISQPFPFVLHINKTIKRMDKLQVIRITEMKTI